MFDIDRLLRGEHFDSVEQANEFLRQAINAGVPRPEGYVPPIERAQAKIYDAWEADGERRIALAKEALELSPDCADAYVLLAEESVDTAEEALPFLELAVEVGKRALGPKYFEENVGHFWGLIETRPYMRALLAKGDCLVRLGDRGLALDCYQELLMLNPEDNLGGRYTLITLLLLDRNDKLAGELLKKYEESTALWAYAYALWVFRANGESEEAFQALIQAFNQNHFVPMYVAGVLQLPEEIPEYYSIGTEEEAIICVGECFEAWIETPRAMEWLVGIVSAIVDDVAEEKPRRPRRRKSKIQ
jgi:tetratricopeptide (TPR) repeat protein